MKHRLALVSYLNTKPFIEGLNKFFPDGELDLELLPPADCPRELANGTCDMALIPVGSLPDFAELSILKDHCIGAQGAVDSVFLFSQVPVTEVDEVILDLHSRTSNGLTRILMQHFWQRQVNFKVPESRDFDLIEGKTAGVAIGDVAYKIKDRYNYVYDLSEEWMAYTGLPFVFAVWAYKGDRWATGDLQRMVDALEWGRAHRREAAHKWGGQFGYSREEAERYLCQSIRYRLDQPKHQALERYITELKALD